MSDTVLVETHPRWVEITLNRPDKLNSFNDTMHTALRAAFQTAISDKKRAILLTGAGRSFCAGQDLGDRDPAKMKRAPDLGQTLIQHYNPLIRLIQTADAPVICAVNGVAAGAGASLALACDIVLAADTAKFIQSFANVGLIPDAGGSWHLTHLLGLARAKGLALTGKPLTAQQAADWGLVWECIAAQDLMAKARALAENLSNGPIIGYAHTKAALHKALNNTLEAQLDLEAEFQKICGASSDYAEGVSAFLAKRTPQFKGQ